MNETMISIVIPVYNTEQYVGECIQSVLQQTYYDMEVIIIDDCSTDGSLAIIQAYAKKDARVTVIVHECNQGVSVSRNDGLAQSCGKYLYFLDSDDTLVSEVLCEMIPIMEAADLDALLLDTTLQKEYECKVFERYRTTLESDYASVKDGHTLFTSLIRYNEFIASPPRYLWRREFILKTEICFLNGIIHEDELFTTQMLLSNPRIRYVSKPIFNRRVRANSIMTMPITIHNIYSYYMILRELVILLSKVSLPMEVYQVLMAITKKWRRKLDHSIHLFYSSAKNVGEIRDSHYLYRDEFYNYVVSLQESVFSLEVWNELNAVNEIIIYGAGAYARSFIEELNEHEIEVLGVAVTKKPNRQSFLYGYKVRNLEEFKDNLDVPILLAVKLHVEEMEQYAKGLGFTNIIKITN